MMTTVTKTKNLYCPKQTNKSRSAMTVTLQGKPINMQQDNTS